MDSMNNNAGPSIPTNEFGEVRYMGIDPTTGHPVPSIGFPNPPVCGGFSPRDSKEPKDLREHNLIRIAESDEGYTINVSHKVVNFVDDLLKKKPE